MFKDDQTKDTQFIPYGYTEMTKKTRQHNRRPHTYVFIYDVTPTSQTPYGSLLVPLRIVVVPRDSPWYKTVPSQLEITKDLCLSFHRKTVDRSRITYSCNKRVSINIHFNKPKDFRKKCLRNDIYLRNEDPTGCFFFWFHYVDFPSPKVDL